QFQNALRAVTYINSSDNPSTAARTVSYSVNDGALGSNVTNSTITVSRVNDAPIGTVTISGSPTRGQTLTAANTLQDADGIGTVNYQWFANGQAISGSNNATLTLTQSQVGQTISVQASYIDGGGSQESRLSSSTAPIASLGVPLGDSGELVHPVQVNGKTYYYWDRSGDGTISGDLLSHDQLDSIFRYDQYGNLNPGSRTNNVYRYATIGGVTVALPTHGGSSSGSGISTVATDISAIVAGQSTYKLDSGGYQDLLAIWDAYNTPFSGANNSGVVGTPSNWYSGPYWSATPSTINPQTQYANVFLNLGGVGSWGTGSVNNVALQLINVGSDIVHPSTIQVVIEGADSNGQPKLTSLRNGDKVVATVAFSEVVSVQGNPTFVFQFDGQVKTATYVSGSGTTSLKFSYTVTSGDSDTAGGVQASTNALSLNRGSLRDLAGNDAALTISSVGSNQNSISVDAIEPSVMLGSDKTGLKVGESATLTFTFTEDPASSFDNSDITVSGGMLGPISGTGLSRSLTFTPTANSSGTATVSVAANQFNDAAGNVNTASNSLSLSFNTITPTLANTPATPALNGGGNSLNDTITLTLNFTESVTGLETGTNSGIFTVGGQPVSASWGGLGTTRTLTYTVAAGQNSQAAIDEAALKSALIAGIANTAGNTFDYTLNNGAIPNIDATPLPVVDSIAPTVSLSSNMSSLKAGETATISFTFNEDPVSSFDNSDITVSGGTLGTISGTGLTRSASFTPAANSNVTANISVAANQFNDVAGNVNTAPSSLSILVQTANTAPNLMVTGNQTLTTQRCGGNLDIKLGRRHHGCRQRRS
ncbi:MAG: hypothetical protein EB072_10610, partial [Betaproteobacteria bacterium]|nr:hypothetical protein [Betaproteobacteria bacterium]